MLLEVQRNAFEELLLADKLQQHAKHYRHLSVAFPELTNMGALEATVEYDNESKICPI